MKRIVLLSQTSLYSVFLTSADKKCRIFCLRIFLPSESELAHPDGGEVGPGADFREVGVRAKT